MNKPALLPARLPAATGLFGLTGLGQAAVATEVSSA